MSEFPPGLMRLAGTDPTRNPDEADVFVIPCGLHHLGAEGIKRLPHIEKYPRKHTGLNIADMLKPIGVPGMWVRCDATKSLVAQESTTIPWPWPIENLGEWSDHPFDRDVVFVGWASSNLTDLACESVIAHTDLDSLIQRKDEFYGYVPASKEKEDSHTFFLDTLAGSRVSICPRSIPLGVWRYRAWEAVSIGRVVAHICDGVVYPWEDEIDYSAFIIEIPEADADKTGDIIAEWLSKHDDDDIRERGRYARRMYERYLCREDWDTLFTEAVSKALGAT